MVVSHGPTRAMLAYPSNPPALVRQTDEFKIWHPEIEPKDRLIFALDVPTRADVESKVATLGDLVQFYKVGWELFFTGDYLKIVDYLVDEGKKVLCDLKIHDIPTTVKRAVKNLKGRPGMYLTFFAQDAGVLTAAVGAKNGIKIIAVTTALTSKDRDDLIGEGQLPAVADVDDLVAAQAAHAFNIGCDGIVCSALEAPKLRRKFEGSPLIFSPGIRPLDAGVVKDDQKRVTTPADAFALGADYIIVGRPIRDADDPRAAAEKIQETIAELFPKT